MNLYLHGFSDRLVLLALAMLASLMLGGPGAVHHFLLLDRPARAGKRFIAALERKLNRVNRSASTRRRRGMVAVVIVFLLCAVLGSALGALSHLTTWGMGLELLIMTLLLPARPALEVAGEFSRRMQEKNRAPAVAFAAPYSRRDDLQGDAHAAARSMVEYLALHFSRRIVAPALWYLALGLPAMLFITALAVMDRAFGSRALSYGPFGAWASRLDDIAQLVPARVSALLLACASVLAPGCNPLRSIKGAVGGSAKTASPNSGVILGAAAGALGITLAGPRIFLGWRVADAWIDYGTAKAESLHVRRMRYLYLCAFCLAAFAAMAANLPQIALK